MLLNDIPVNEIFTIGETPTYPKLRTATGWVDMRDLIVVDATEINVDCRIMSTEEITALWPNPPHTDDIDSEIQMWKKHVLANTKSRVTQENNFIDAEAVSNSGQLK